MINKYTTSRSINMKCMFSQASSFLPDHFKEQVIRIYCKLENAHEVVLSAFIAWCEDNQLPAP